MTIYDAHMHLGASKSSGMHFDEELVVKNCERYNVAGGLLLPFPLVEDVRAAHDRIAEFCRDHPTFVGATTLNPVEFGFEESAAEMERCAKDLGFRVAKVHPASHAMTPLSPAAGVIFETAARLGMAVMIHTGWGLPFSLPALAIPRAQQFPELPIILAHAGYGAACGPEAIVAAQTCPNIYLETSWCWGMDILGLIRQVGAERVLMGTDMPENVGPVLAIYDTLDITPEQRAACLGDNFARLFALESAPA